MQMFNWVELYCLSKMSSQGSNSSGEFSVKEGFVFVEEGSRSVFGYEVESFGFPVGLSDVEEVYAGSWARKRMESTFDGYTLGYRCSESCLDAVTLCSEEALNHLVLGRPGVGKTVYLRNFLVQAAAHGQGFCYLDRFDDQDDILHLLPEGRLDDVVLLEMESDECLDYDYLYDIIQEGKIVLFQPQSYLREGSLELDEIIRTLVDARSGLDDPDPFYLAWDHMYDVTEGMLPRSVIHDLMSRGCETNVGTVFTGGNLDSIHSREASRELLVRESDVYVGFDLDSSERNEFALEYDLPVYKTEVRYEMGSGDSDYTAIVSTPDFDPMLVNMFAQFPPRRSKRDIFSGPLLRYKM